MRRRSDRYDLTEARDLGQRGEPAKHAIKSRNVETGTVAVVNPLLTLVDPTTAKKKGRAVAPDRVIATVNRRVDILEWELSHGRISSAAYGEGRIIQALYERAGISGASTWNEGSRVDAEIRKELALIRRVTDAKLINRMLQEIEIALGKRNVDNEIVRQVLGENRRYADVELPQRTPVESRSDVAYIAQRFRDALELLSRERNRR